MDAFQNFSLPPVSFRFLNQNLPGIQAADRIRNAVAGCVEGRIRVFLHSRIQPELSVRLGSGNQKVAGGRLKF